MRIIIIRHLETSWNREGRIQGSNDILVLPPGEQVRADIKSNLETIRQESPSLILTSQLTRTKETASYYGFDETTEEPLLNEFDFGEFEGCDREEMFASLGEAWFECPQTLTFGESMMNLQKRIELLFDKYQSYDSLLAFGHGMWLRAALSLMQVQDLSLMNKLSAENNKLYEVSL